MCKESEEFIEEVLWTSFRKEGEGGRYQVWLIYCAGRVRNDTRRGVFPHYFGRYFHDDIIPHLPPKAAAEEPLGHQLTCIRLPVTAVGICGYQNVHCAALHSCPSQSHQRCTSHRAGGSVSDARWEACC